MKIPDKETRDEWRRLAKETMMISALGEYTPEEVEILLDSVDQLEFDIKLLKNDKDILVECLQKAQVKIGKDTKPNFIDLALALVKR